MNFEEGHIGTDGKTGSKQVDNIMVGSDWVFIFAHLGTLLNLQRPLLELHNTIIRHDQNKQASSSLASIKSSRELDRQIS